MKSEIRFKKTAVLLLAAALIGTVLAAFLPYALEPLLGLAAACIAVHAVFLAHEKFIHPFWVTLLAAAASAVSVVLTLVLILGHRLGLYTLIQALNLVVIGLSTFILLHKKWVYRAAVCTITAVCLAFAVFGAFSHIAYVTDHHPVKPEFVTQPAAGSRSAILLPIPCSRYHRCSIPGPVQLRESRSAPHTA